MTRLIKASSKKPTKDSVINGTTSPTASVVSLGASGQSTQHRMTAAQAELQGCEKQLAEKQRQLDQIRSIAIRDGLEQRCNALIRLGTTLSDKGNEGVRALQEGYAAATTANGVPPIDVSELFRNLPPRPSSPNGFSDTSLAPSQSASQSGTPSGTQSRSYAQYAALNGNGNGAAAQNSPVRATNAINESNSDSEEDGDDNGAVQVVENNPRGPTSPGVLSPNSTVRESIRLPQRDYASDIGPSIPRAHTLQRSNMRRQESSSTAGGSEPRKKSGGFFGAMASLFKSSHNSPKKSKPAAGASDVRKEPGSPLKQSNSAWQTRTDRNLALARGEARDTSDSEDDIAGGRFVAVENKPGSKLTLPSSSTTTSGTVTPLGRKPTTNGKAGGSGKTPLVSQPPRKLQRSSSTSKVPSANAPAKRGRGTGSVVGNPTTPPMPTPTPSTPANNQTSNVPPSLMRAGTVKSDSGSTIKGERGRTSSLPGAPGVSPPDAPPPRSSARGKPLKLTGPVDKDPNAWIHGPGTGSGAASPAPASSHHRSTSVRSAQSVQSSSTIVTTKSSTKSGGKSGSPHKRGASLDVKTPNLMTLVEDVVSDRQRSEALRPLQANNSAAPRMMLPSEYMKVTMPAHGYDSAVPTATPSRSHTMPTFVVNPPTPAGEHPSHGPNHFAPDKGKEKEKRFPVTAAVDEQPKHNPPPRSASPLRSAMRHPTASPSTISSSLPPKPTSVAAPEPIAAPVPVRPVSVNRNSMSIESDAASAYETADSEEDDTPDAIATPTRTLSPDALQQQQQPTTSTPSSRLVPIQNGSPPSTISTSTDQGIDGAQRRKSVRLNVPPTPDATTFGGRNGDDDDEKPLPPPKRLSAASQWNSRIADPEQPNGGVRDVWANSSDEDEDYKRARRALSKAIKKEKVAHAEAAAVIASSGPSSSKKAKRHTMKY